MEWRTLLSDAFVAVGPHHNRRIGADASTSAGTAVNSTARLQLPKARLEARFNPWLS
jgi:hypothetical protein